MGQSTLPSQLYHGLTLDRFVEHWEAGCIRAFSKHHVDQEGNRKGVWLSDSFDYIIENKHGMEYTDDVLIETELLGKKITCHKMKTGIILELSNVPNHNALVPLFVPNQLFYFGEIPISYIDRVHVDQRHDEQWKARDIRQLLERGVPGDKISVYDPFTRLIELR